MARVGSPAVASAQTMQSGRFGSTRVSGPGQNEAARAWAAGVRTTRANAASASATCAISGLWTGRPFASNTARTATGSVASAPRP